MLGFEPCVERRVELCVERLVLGRSIMLNNLRHPAYLKFATTCLAGAFVAIAAAPTVADEQFAPTTVVQLPDSQIMSAFDISFVKGAATASLMAHPASSANVEPQEQTLTT